MSRRHVCINRRSTTWRSWTKDIARFDDGALIAEVDRVREGVARYGEVDWRVRWRMVHAETCRRGWAIPFREEVS